MASGLSVASGPEVTRENKLNAMFGGKGGGMSLPKGSAGIGGRAVGGLTLFDNLGLWILKHPKKNQKI